MAVRSAATEYESGDRQTGDEQDPRAGFGHGGGHDLERGIDGHVQVLLATSREDNVVDRVPIDRTGVGKQVEGDREGQGRRGAGVNGKASIVGGGVAGAVGELPGEAAGYIGAAEGERKVAGKEIERLAGAEIGTQAGVAVGARTASQTAQFRLSDLDPG